MYLDYATRAMKFSVNEQLPDGSWLYGEYAKQNWIDSFHTGYNLMALKKYEEYTGNQEFRPSMLQGFEYYINNFFTDEGIVKYFNDKIYPIDTHSIAHSLVTLSEFKDFNENVIQVAYKVFELVNQ